MNTEWKQIKSILSKEMSAGSFLLWFSQVTGELVGETLVLHPPTEYAGNRITGKFLPTIKKIAVAVLGFSPSITVEPRVVDTMQNMHQSSSAVTTPAVGATVEPCEATPLKVCNTLPDSFIASEHTIVAKQGNSAAINTLPSKTVAYIRSNIHAVSNAQDMSDLPSSCGMSIPVGKSSSVQPVVEPVQGYMNLLYTKREMHFHHSFDSFVVGDCNALAHASSKALCDTTNTLASCLYLSSSPGLGKTHLLHALGSELTKVSNLNRTHIEYLSAEDFTTQFTMAMQQKQLTQFLGRLKSADVLLLEDVHFLQGKEKMQSQLLSVIKALQARSARIVVSSSFSLKDIKDIDTQLASCFQEGYVANILAPDAAFRREVVRRKASFHNIFLPEPVTEAIAEGICSDIRQIEGCLKTLILKARSLNQEISLPMALDVLSSYATTLEKSISFTDIVQSVCKAFGIGKDRLTSKSRQKECVLARNVIFYLARVHTDMTLKEVAMMFNRQHSTVIKGVTSIEQEIVRSTPKAQQIISIVNQFDTSCVLHA